MMVGDGVNNAPVLAAPILVSPWVTAAVGGTPAGVAVRR